MRKYPPRPKLTQLDGDTDPAAQPEPVAPERPAKPRGKPGPAPDPDALHAQLGDGRGAHLHAVIPAELHQRLKVRSVMTGATLSQMVAEAVTAYLEAAKPKA